MSHTPFGPFDVQTLLLSCFFLMAMFALVVLFVIDWALHVRQTWRFWKFAFVLGGLLIAMDVGVALLLPPLRTGTIGGVLLATEVAVFGPMMLLAVMGMYCCVRMRQPDLPLLSRLFGRQYGRRRVRPVAMAISALLVVGVGVAYSRFLFWLVPPQASRLLKDMFGAASGLAAAPAGWSDQPSLGLGLFVVTYALKEEVIFRLGVQNFLSWHLNFRGWKCWFAIAIGSALWTIAHTGMLSSDWMKFAQIFPLGFGLGWLCRKHGAEAAILAHAAFNVTMMFLA